MNWFQRHLNWSLFFGISLIPGLVSTAGLIIIIIQAASSDSMDTATFTSGLLTYLTMFSIAVLITSSLVIWWYLGRKARSKWYLLLFIVPMIISIMSIVVESGQADPINEPSIIVTLLRGLSGLLGGIGFIWLLCLQNRAVDYSFNLAAEGATGQWQDTGRLGGIDDRQYKELDYTPTQNVLDISGGGVAADVSHTSDVSKAVDSGTVEAEGEKAPEQKKVVEKPAGHQRLQLPILLDDAGKPISCFYHPGADAVNFCSRCKQYVCAECNYITGTYPICHNCWDKRASVPIAPPAQKQTKPAPVKPQKQKAEPSVEPEKQKVVEAAQVKAHEALEPAVLEMPQVIEPVESVKAPTATVVVPAEPVEQKYTEPMKTEPPIIVAPPKAIKQELEKSNWQQEFMALYEQASPIINAVTSKSPDGMPASPLDLMEGLKLRPMLERAKKLSKPKDKELREVKSDFEGVMSSCIKIANAAANFVSSGGQALLGGPDFKRIVDGIDTANGLLEKLSRRLAAFSNPQE